MPKIIVAGHTCVDLIPQWNGKFEDIKPGYLIVTGQMIFSTGGAVPNTGVDLKRLGLDPILIGKIGNDLIGKITLEVISRDGKDLTKYISKSTEAGSSYTLVLSPPNADRAFLHYPGVNDTFCAKNIPFDEIEGRIFHFGYPPLVESTAYHDGAELVKIFKNAHERKMVTSLDMTMPDPNYESGRIDWKRFLSNVLPHTDIFLPSLDEILFMTQKRSDLTHKLLIDLTDELFGYGLRIAVIKLGEDGAYLRSGKIKPDDLLAGVIETKAWSETEILSPAFKTDVIGTTGSGDASIAGFLSKFAQGANPKETMDFMCATGAFCTEAVDSTSGVKHMRVIEERIKQGWDRLPSNLEI
ncbi:MAG: carbohydrate kinase family protein [Thermotogae bacterium]|nr:carbohydrate kinase family protein [Thermotogota bacterium]